MLSLGHMTKACALIGPFRGGPEKDPSWGRIFFGVGVSTVWGFRSISYFGDSLRKGQTKKFKGGGQIRLEMAIYGQLSPGAVVTWSVVTWSVVPLIRSSFLAS